MMDEYVVVYSEEAKDDLWAIYRYILDDLSSPMTAQRLAAIIRQAIADLNFFPERFQRIHWHPWERADLHIMPVENYLVIYRVQIDRRCVQIVRILHGRQHLNAFLEKYLEE